MNTHETPHATPKRPEDRTSPRLEDNVYSELLRAIRSGEFSLGQRLPSENDLAGQYGVSRPVIRTALARLRDDGLIESRQGAGSFVISGGASEGDGFGPLNSIEDISAYFRFRKMIEAETAAQAAQRVDPGEIAALRSFIREMQERTESEVATIDPDLSFHTKIAELSDNRFLVDTLRMLRPQMKFIGKFVRSLGRTGYRLGKRDMNNEHEAIVAALEAKDADAARAAMVAHIEASERRVFKGEG